MLTGPGRLHAFNIIFIGPNKVLRYPKRLSFKESSFLFSFIACFNAMMFQSNLKVMVSVCNPTRMQMIVCMYASVCNFK